jgi:two-component system alkaline phosphatase synthesis response regulator PhoP
VRAESAEKKQEREAFSGKFKIDREKREVLVDGQAVDLALKEFDLLYFLVQNTGVVVSREQALEHVWGYDFFGETRTVDVHVRNIRRKLEEKGMHPECIKTVRGVGYKFQAEK